MTIEIENFSDLGLSTPILSALTDLGYQKPSPIQLECIPHLINGCDVLGMAQTGSGKTAAFGIPLLSKIKVEVKAPQMLVLTPTRELAMQVSEALKTFAKYIPGINILALYGGQPYDVQLRALRRGAQIIVGTPGRLLDHLKRGTLKLTDLNSLVLDEADEMLRMGFIDDVETIMAKIPAGHQTALFSATMPEAIRKITRRFMKEPHEVRIQSNITTRPAIHQCYWSVSGASKSEALLRFLETEDFDAVIIFVRTKNATQEVADTLKNNGYNCAALNGDMNQALREQTLESLKKGRLDILIATDVAARGLDVDRISLVINYDTPMDAECYVHRIGRTGRAGRAGRALLFVEHREKRQLNTIERITKQQSIPEVKLPTREVLAERRKEKFIARIKQLSIDKSSSIAEYRPFLPMIASECGIDSETLSVLLLMLAQGNNLLIPAPEPLRRYAPPPREFNGRDNKKYNNDRRDNSFDTGSRSAPRRERLDVGKMDVYRIDVGRDDGIEVRHIVGTIANEADINSRLMGNIKLFASYSTIELPKSMPADTLSHLAHTCILHKPMNMHLLSDVAAQPYEKRERSEGGSHSRSNGSEVRGGSGGAVFKRSTSRSGSRQY